MLASFIRNLCLTALLVSLFVVVSKSDEGSTLNLNYVATAELLDGEHEVRMRFGKVIVRDTFVTHESLDGVRRGLMLRQVGSGPHFLQLIYKLTYPNMTASQHQKLAECEVINDWNTANQFRTQFKLELQKAGLQLDVPVNANVNANGNADKLATEGSRTTDMEGYEDVSMMMGDNNDMVDVEPIDLNQGTDEYRNVTVKLFRDDEVTAEMKKAFNIKAHKRHCNRLHERMKQVKDSKNQSLSGRRLRRDNREMFQVGIMPGTFWCGGGTSADTYESMGAHVGTDRCCRDHDAGCPFNIDAMSSKYGMFNYRMHTISHCTCDERDSSMGSPKKLRWKRELSNALQLPGTQWCGRSFSDKENTQLGAYTGTDNCCRYHDLGCPFYIEAFEEKYSLFNWRMYTINHCTCDERFRSCLKQTNTGAANFVGKVFFNIMQTKCFLLKPERFCAKLSWFGKCLKHEYKKQAHLRDPIPY